MKEKLKSECEAKNNTGINIQQKRRLRVTFFKVSLMAILLILSTYAWFTSQKDITLSNIRGVVEVVENMEISLDAKTWHQEIDLTDAKNLFENAQESRNRALGEFDVKEKSTALAMLPNQLLPVSAQGEKNSALIPMYTGEATSTSLSVIVRCAEETVDSDGYDIAADNGYFAFDIYIKNTSRDNENDVLQLNINSTANVLTETIKKMVTDDSGNVVEREYKGNDASGLQNAIRIALARYTGTITSTATQEEILQSTKGATVDNIAIWEPNAYDHVESIVANNNKLINGSEENKITFDEYDTEGNVVTYALNETAVTAGNIENVYNIASAGLGLQRTLKTDNIKNGGGKVTEYRIYTPDLKPIDIKNTEGNNFEIQANSVTRYRVYVWLEGQDVDCINIASLGGGIELDLGLTKDNEVGDVMGNRLVANTSYETVGAESDNVKVTITTNKQIELPDGWTYTNETTKTEITKTYASENVIEEVEIKDLDGNTVTIEVTTGAESAEIEDEVEIGPDPNSFAGKVASDKFANYGRYTDYSIDIDGITTDNDWRIFYNDNENVFLIADDYVKHDRIKSGVMSRSTESGFTTYCSYWDMYGSNYTDPPIDPAVISKYLFTDAEITSGSNYESVVTLLTPSKWDNFLDSDLADSAVGGPTIEMFAKSWNSKYQGNDAYPQVSYACEDWGYWVGTTVADSNVVTLTGYENESAKVYFPHTTYDNLDGTTSGDCEGYWLASPSAYSPTTIILVDYQGRIQLDGCWYGFKYAVRPVVCLKSEVQGTLNGEIWELTIGE